VEKPMSTTPVCTALPTSKVGMALGPPMKLICATPLPSLLKSAIQSSVRFT